MDDGDEVRLGFEYAVNAASAPLAFLRWGVWRDPDHEIEYVGPLPSQRAIFSPGDDELHWTLGGGLKLGDVQLDAGYDRSERLDVLSVSAVFYVGRN
jgi:hypothetical protein